MIFKKDQAAKLRSLAEKEGISKKEEVLTYSSLMGDKSAKKTQDILLIGALGLSIFVLIALGMFLFGQNEKRYRDIIDSVNKQSQTLGSELSLLNSKTSSLESELTENVQRNQNLVGQVKTLSALNSNLKDKLSGIEKERMTLAKEILQAHEKALALETAKKDLETEFKKHVSGLESKIVQLTSKVEQMKAAVIEGEVVFINAEHQFALINLGNNKGLARGMRLDVISGDAVIGELEVVEARQDVSACNVIMDFSKLDAGQKVRLK